VEKSFVSAHSAEQTSNLQGGAAQWAGTVEISTPAISNRDGDCAFAERLTSCDFSGHRDFNIAAWGVPD
jgi:hypothetical protein